MAWLAVTAALCAAPLPAGAIGEHEESIRMRARRELELALQRQYPQVIRWEVTARAARNERAFPAGAPDIEVGQLGVRSVVRLTWREPDAVKTRSLWFDVAGQEPTLVVKRRLSAGERIASDDTLIESRDLLGAGCNGVVDANELQGMRTTRALSAGAPICREVIEPRPPVVRGDAIRVRYESGAIQLEIKAVAQNDAQVGEAVRVRNASSGKIFEARVSNGNEAVLRE